MGRLAYRTALALVLLFALGVGGPAWGQTPGVEFDETAVTLSGITPGGEVVVYWLARGVRGFSPWTSRLVDVVSDEDLDGRIRYELEGRVPEESIWAVVDRTTGLVATGSPLDGPLREIAPPRGLVSTLAGEGHFDEEAYRRDLLVVRPGVGDGAGAWVGSLTDGGSFDGDGARDGQVRARLDRLEPAVEDGPPPPARFRPGDVLVVGDSERLVFWVRRVPDLVPVSEAGEEVSR